MCYKEGDLPRHILSIVSVKIDQELKGSGSRHPALPLAPLKQGRKLPRPARGRLGGRLRCGVLDGFVSGGRSEGITLARVASILS